jgi:hypothetical protein
MGFTPAPRLFPLAPLLEATGRSQTDIQHQARLSGRLLSEVADHSACHMRMLQHAHTRSLLEEV